MSTGFRARRRFPASTICLVIVLTLTASAIGAQAGEAPSGHRVRLSHQRPPCSQPPGMPIVPNDPGALVTHDGTRCYGTRAPELDLYLPADGYLWLTPSTRNPAVWIELGGVVVDPLSLDPPPLGLRLTVSDGSWNLETRQGGTATLTHLEPGVWGEVTTPDDQRFWILAGDGERPPTTLGHGRIRRAD